MIFMARRKLPKDFPKDKGFRQLYDLTVHTRRTLRKSAIVSQIQPEMVQTARAHIFTAYKKKGLVEAEKVYSNYLKELEQWISQKHLSAEEAKGVRDNLDSFINAIRKKSK